MASVLKVDQIQSDTGTVNISSNVVFSSGLTAGSAAAPSIFPTGDTNTGIFFPAADRVGVSTGGTQRVEVDSSGRVGIGTSSPSQRFVVYDATGADNIIMATQGDAASMFMQASSTGDVGTINNFNVRFLQNNTFAAGIDTSKNFQFNSGYGSVATAYGCRAWVNFDGTTNVGGNCTIRASGNVSTVADNGQGNYTVNFTTAMPDANYAFMGGVKPQTGQSNETFGRIVSAKYNVSPTTSALRIITCTTANGPEDFDIVCVAIFR